MAFYIFFNILSTLIAGAMCSPPDTTDFFPNIKDNLTKVTWAHAVNNATYLQSVLESDIMMIEADVIMGTLDTDPTNTLQPIMGHPPAEVSDLSLEQFMLRIDESNHNLNRTVKGVKLDFKSIEVFEKSTKTIDTSYHKIQYPLWINADILAGPVESQVVPVDAHRFLKGSEPFPCAMLSIGWTTKYGGNIVDGSYTEDQIDDMIKILERHDVKQKCTFPVRAGLAANSLKQIERLLSASLDSTLTIWSSQGDFVDIDKLRRLILSTGLDRVYLDVPKDISDLINL